MINIEKKKVIKKEQLISTVKAIVTNSKGNYDEYKDFVEFVLSKIKDRQDINLEYTIIVNKGVATVTFKLSFESDAEFNNNNEIPKDVTVNVGGKLVYLGFSGKSIGEEMKEDNKVMDDVVVNASDNKLESRLDKIRIEVSNLYEVIHNNLDIHRKLPVELENMKDKNVTLYDTWNKLENDKMELSKLVKELKSNSLEDIEQFEDKLNKIDSEYKLFKSRLDLFNVEYSSFIKTNPYVTESEKKENSKKEDKEYKFDKDKFFEEAERPVLYAGIGVVLSLGIGAIYNAFKK